MWAYVPHAKCSTPVLTLLHTEADQATPRASTQVTNLDAIARTLGTRAAYLFRHFQQALEVGGNAETYTLEGYHPLSALQPLLADFVDDWVLCPTCQRPDLRPVATSESRLRFECRACASSQYHATSENPLLQFICSDLRARSDVRNMSKSK